MMMLSTNLNGCRISIQYVRSDSDCYIARIEHVGSNKLLTFQTFGNGVDAENWLLRELSFPESILLLKYH